MNGARIILAAAALSCAAAAARPVDYKPPEEAIPDRFAGPETEIVRTNCIACHSLDYLATQPPGKGVVFWRDAVNKMIHVYGAPVAPDDVDPIATAIAGSE